MLTTILAEAASREPTELTERVVNASLIVGVLLMVGAGVVAAFELASAAKVAAVATKATEGARDAATPTGDKEGDAQKQSAVATAVSAVASLATALKDLDRSTRMMTLALAFFAVAAVTAGADAIAAS